jgi:hypothetical protein
MSCSFWLIYDFDVCTLTRPITIKAMVPYLFTFSAFTLAWVCFTGATSQRLQNITKRCSAIDFAITNTLRKLKNNLVPRWLKSSASAEEPPVPPPVNNAPN